MDIVVNDIIIIIIIHDEFKYERNGEMLITPKQHES